MSDDALFALYCDYLSRIRADFQKEWVRGWWVFRNRFAQPICQIGFRDHVPAIQTPIRGLYLTDSYQLHPDDRTISNSSGLGRTAARLVLEGIRRGTLQ
jgi:hypothetical protein